MSCFKKKQSSYHLLPKIKNKKIENNCNVIIVSFFFPDNN